ncbi:conserved hypothetical protein [Parafrankia sp. EAN1pec]|nr:conserved hypothetical protein [Frankia sp. EAN1pec]
MEADSPARPRPSGAEARTLRFRLVTATGPVCSLAGVIAALASFRPWTHATLADRGADLLVVNQTGWELAPAGQLVFAVGVVVTLLVLIPPAEENIWLRRLIPVAGLVMVIIPLTALQTAEPVARKLERLRIGTFQTENPAATHGTAFGLWVILAAGAVILVAGCARLVLERSTRPGGDVSRPTDAASPPAGRAPDHELSPEREGDPDRSPDRDTS